jgi:DNA (cytosine-5)-methyltransferase 1
MKISSPRQLSVVGLFAGCGGLDFGFKQAGFHVGWANELDADASASYKQLVGDHVVTGSLLDNMDQVPQADIVVGGPPCQSFSLSGLRRPDDERGKLVFAYRDVIRTVRPGAFVMENVSGITSSKIDGTPLLDILCRDFESYGYQVSVHKLLATDFFVPQRRVRVLVVGQRTTDKQFSILPREAFGSIIGISNSRAVNVSEALDDLPQASTAPLKPYESDPHSDYARSMRSGADGLVSLQAAPTMSKLDREFVRHIPPGGNYTAIPDSIATQRIMRIKETGGRTTCYGRLHPDAPSYTINTYFNRPNVGANYHHREERLITPREALRLQSFPDCFTPRFRSQRSLHKQIGNAVPPLLARAVAESLKGLFQ